MNRSLASKAVSRAANTKVVSKAVKAGSKAAADSPSQVSRAENPDKSRGKADNRVASAKASAGSCDQSSPALAGDFFVGDFFRPEITLRRRATHTATGYFEDAATNRVREGARPSSTGAVAGPVDLGPIDLGPLDLGEPARNGPCQRVGILAEGPNRRKFMAAGAGQYQRRLPVLSAFICKFDGAENGFAPIAECALQLAGLHDPLFASLQHDELDEFGHLVKSAKQPNQKDDRNRDSD